MDQSVLSALLNLHGEWRASLLVRLLQMLFALWAQPGVVNDPPTVRAVTAKTIALVDAAILQSRQMENIAFVQIAEQLGVPYDYDETLTEQFYPRSADMREVYERVIAEYRWHAYGKQNAADRDLDLDADVEYDEEFSFTVGGDDVTLDIPEIEYSQQILDALDADEEEFDRQAFIKAWQRMVTMVEADLNMGRRDENRQLMDKKSIWIGYRRVIHPERSRTGTCGLCVVAATQVYQKKDLAPIHNKCECTQLPVTADIDPGKELNRNDIDGIFVGGEDSDEVRRLGFSRADLQRIYGAAGGYTDADSLREVRIHRGTHGELGPVLSWSEPRGNREHPDYVSPTIEQSREMWQSTLDWATSERGRLQALIRRGAKGPNAIPYTVSVQFYEDLIQRMRENLNGN